MSERPDDQPDDQTDDQPVHGQEPEHPTAAPAGPYPGRLDERLLTPAAPLPPGAAIRVLPGVMDPVPAPMTPPAWAADPAGRHQWRWWNGLVWTDHVADDGVAGEDPLDPR